MPPGRYRMQQRLRHACRLLTETSLSVHAVAAACGFADPLYFSRKFSQAVGMTATAYRQRHRSALGYAETGEAAAGRRRGGRAGEGR